MPLIGFLLTALMPRDDISNYVILAPRLAIAQDMSTARACVFMHHPTIKQTLPGYLPCIG